MTNRTLDPIRDYDPYLPRALRTTSERDRIETDQRIADLKAAAALRKAAQAEKRAGRGASFLD